MWSKERRVRNKDNEQLTLFRERYSQFVHNLHDRYPENAEVFFTSEKIYSNNYFAYVYSELLIILQTENTQSTLPLNPVEFEEFPSTQI